MDYCRYFHISVIYKMILGIILFFFFCHPFFNLVFDLYFVCHLFILQLLLFIATLFFLYLFVLMLFLFFLLFALLIDFCYFLRRSLDYLFTIEYLGVYEW